MFVSRHAPLRRAFYIDVLLSLIYDSMVLTPPCISGLSLIGGSLSGNYLLATDADGYRRVLLLGSAYVLHSPTEHVSMRSPTASFSTIPPIHFPISREASWRTA